MSDSDDYKGMFKELIRSQVESTETLKTEVAGLTKAVTRMVIRFEEDQKNRDRIEGNQKDLGKRVSVLEKKDIEMRTKLDLLVRNLQQQHEDKKDSKKLNLSIIGLTVTIIVAVMGILGLQIVQGG